MRQESVPAEKDLLAVATGICGDWEKPLKILEEVDMALATHGLEVVMFTTGHEQIIAFRFEKRKDT